jgi:hypothetical protein
MFRSFYMAGFECATGYNMHGEWIDQIAATHHDHHLSEDYARLAEVDIHTVREAIRWPLVDQRGRYDFSSVEPFVHAALRHQFDVVWDLFHFGYPDDLDPFSDGFVDRFGAYCRAAARFICRRMPAPHSFTPVNEPSYFAWAAGEAGRFAPHVQGRGYELKVNLARACLGGVDAIREVCPDARIVNVDPICRVVPPVDASDETIAFARRFNEEWVFQFWDIMRGRLLPELGGRRDRLDVVGLNYYWTNQWEVGKDSVPLADDDPRRVPLADLVRQVHQRYGTDVVITETSALGDARAPWVHELSVMAEQLLDDGVKLGGICLYPILGMPEWHARDEWRDLGLWDVAPDQHALQRKICEPMLDALCTAQSRGHARGIGTQRRFLLPRTGTAPFLVVGTLVCHVVGPSYELRLIRSDQPYRLWVASITVRAGTRLARHVSTAADLTVLVEALRRSTPGSLAREHGLPETNTPEESALRWRHDLGSLLEQGPSFEQYATYSVRGVEHPHANGRY